MGRGYVHALLSNKLGRNIRLNESVLVKADLVYIQDRIARYLFEYHRDLLLHRFVDFHLFFDHEAPPSTPEKASIYRQLKDTAFELGIYIHDEGAGISHQVVCETLALPGQIICSPDSHISQVGAIGALGIEVGAKETALISQTAEVLVSAPPTVIIELFGSFPSFVTSFDLMWYLSYRYKPTLVGKILEFRGDSLNDFQMNDRFTLANLSTDIGALYGIVPPDDITFQWISRTRGITYFENGSFDIPKVSLLDAEQHIRISLNEIPMMVLTEEGPLPLEKVAIGQKITRVAVGSCTNGSTEDIKKYCDELGSMPAKHLTITVTPGSRKTLLDIWNQGIGAELVKCGVIINSPGCGPCMGLNLGVAGDGDTVLTTHPSSKQGRMGSKKSKLFAVNPRIAGYMSKKGSIDLPC